MTFTKANFIKGQYEELASNLTSSFKTDSNAYIPYKRDKLAPEQYNQVANTHPIVKACVNLIGSKVGENGWSIHVNVSKNADKNAQIAQDIQNILAGPLSYLIPQSAVQIPIDGTCVWMVNSEEKPVLFRKHAFDFYWDNTNQKFRNIEFWQGGNKILSGLEAGEHLWILKDPAGAHLPLPTSRIDACYEQILTSLHIWQMTNDLWSRGLVAPKYVSFSEKGVEYWTKEVSTDGGPVDKFLLFMRRMRESLTGKMNAVVSIPYLDKMWDATTDFDKMKGEATQNQCNEQIAITFGLTPQDLGLGQTTYNNMDAAQMTADYKIGNVIEQVIEQAVNQWLLPKVYGIDTKGGKIKFAFNPPKNDKEAENKRLVLEALKINANLLTENEMRELLGYGQKPVETQPTAKSETTDNGGPADQKESDANVVEAKFSQKQDEVKKNRFALITEGMTKTFIDQAWESDDFYRLEYDAKGQQVERGFKILMQKAFNKQMVDLQKEFEKAPDFASLKVAVEKMKPLETYLPLPNLVKGLNAFAKQGMNAYLKDIKKEMQKSTALPPFLVDQMQAKAAYLLKGWAGMTPKEQSLLPQYIQENPDKAIYAGLDAETASQIMSIVSKFEDQVNQPGGTDGVVKELMKQIDDMTKKRADLIARTEVAFAVEQSRFMLYSNGGFKFKRWFSVRDDRVRASHDKNMSQGVIDISTKFHSGEMKAGEAPRCRCTTVYGRTKEDLI